LKKKKNIFNIPKHVRGKYEKVEKGGVGAGAAKKKEQVFHKEKQRKKRKKKCMRRWRRHMCVRLTGI